MVAAATLALSTMAGAQTPKHGPWDRYRAPAESPTIWAYQLGNGGGSGSISCATAVSSGLHNNQASAYTLGMWSGMNFGAKASVGLDIDAAGVLGEVKLYCEQHPSDTLLQAVVMTWNRVRAAGK